MHSHHARARPAKANRSWVAMLAAACAAVTGCVAPPEAGQLARAKPADARAEASDAKLLFKAAKWERNGGSYPEVVKETTISIDLKAAATEDLLRIQLPEAAPSFVLRTIGGKKRMANGALVWSASVNDSRHETATFAIVDGILTASIAAPNGRAYRIRHVKDDVYVLQEIDRSKFPPEACVAPRTIRGGLTQPWRYREAATLVQGTPCIPADPADSIEVMVVYTDAALAEAQSAPTMIGAIENAFQQTNTSYSNSGIQQKIVQVYPFTQIHYTEESSIFADLARLKDVNDLQLSAIHVQRKALAADIVVLVTQKKPGACGLARVMTTVSSAAASDAFAVVPYQCLTDTFSFAHELGHLMGARHDIDQDANRNSPFPFNHGFVQTQPTGSAPHPWFTVMGTQTLCTENGMSNCARIDVWSTPDTQFDYYGDVTGVRNEADNQQTLNTTAATVANFMCSSTRVQLAMPSRTALPGDEVKLE